MHATIQRGWCQNVRARNADGRPTAAKDASAIAWCLEGSILRHYTSLEEYGKIIATLESAFDTIHKNGTDNFVVWNDLPGRRKADVIALIEKAIELEEHDV